MVRLDRIAQFELFIIWPTGNSKTEQEIGDKKPIQLSDRPVIETSCPLSPDAHEVKGYLGESNGSLSNSN